MASSNKARFDPRECQASSPIAREVDRQALRQFADAGQRIGIGLDPERAHLAQENICGDGPDSLESEQPLLDLPRVARCIVQSVERATIVRDEHFAVAEDLRRLAAVVTYIAALAHDGIDEEIPASVENLSWVGQTMPDEAPISIFGDSLRNPSAKKQARQKPSKIFGVAPLCQVNPKLFRVKLAALQCAARHFRRSRLRHTTRMQLCDRQASHLKKLSMVAAASLTLLKPVGEIRARFRSYNILLAGVFVVRVSGSA